MQGLIDDSVTKGDNQRDKETETELNEIGIFGLMVTKQKHKVFDGARREMVMCFTRRKRTR